MGAAIGHADPPGEFGLFTTMRAFARRGSGRRAHACEDLQNVGNSKIERRDALAMGQQTVEVTFQGEQVGSYTDKNTTYTLYCVPNSAPNDLYVVHVDEGDESWLETNGGQGLSEGMLGTFFPQLAEAFVGEQVYPHKYR